MPLWHAIFYGTLVVASVVAWADTQLSTVQHATGLGLSILLGIWYWFFIVRHESWRRQPRPMLIYFAGTFVLTLALLQIHPVYFFLAFSLYGQIFGLLPLRWAIAGAVVFSSILLWQQAALAGQSLLAAPGLVLTYSVVAISAILFGLWVNAIIGESHERKELIERLEATRRELAAAEHQAGVLEERQRLAREIHDSLAQGLASTVMQLETVEQLLPNDLTAARQHLDQARRIARESLAEARRFVWALQPEFLQHDSLPNALKRLMARLADESGISADVHVTGTERGLPPEIEVTLLRLAQEATGNIRQHAHATQATLTLSYMPDVVALDVQDNGDGFDTTQLAPPNNDAGGFGLIGMRQRVEQLGGTFTIESGPHEGTTLAVEVPLVSDAALSPAITSGREST